MQKNLQTMSNLTEHGNINAAKNDHKKAAETLFEFERTSCELILQLDKDQHEECIGKLTREITSATWKKFRVTLRKRIPQQINLIHKTTMKQL